MKTQPTAVWPTLPGPWTPEGNELARLIYHAQPFTLYRHFDADGVLLYVGVTDHLERRNAGHRQASPWWPQVARIDSRLCRDFRSASAAERTAIREEAPLYNVVWSRDRAGAKVRREALKAAS